MDANSTLEEIFHENKTATSGYGLVWNGTGFGEEVSAGSNTSAAPWLLIKLLATAVNASASGTAVVVGAKAATPPETSSLSFRLHCYAFACFFFILAFYAFFSILNLRALISARPFMSSINVFLCLLGASRAGVLFIDPYNENQSLPTVLGSVAWDIGFPCLTSAFSLIQLSFVQLTQLKVGPDKVRHKSCLSLIITAHFCLVIGADIAVGIHENWSPVKTTIELIFIVWGLFLSISFLYSGLRFLSTLRSTKRESRRRRRHEEQEQNSKRYFPLALLAPELQQLTNSFATTLGPGLVTPKIQVSEEAPPSPSLTPPCHQLTRRLDPGDELCYIDLPTVNVYPPTPSDCSRRSSQTAMAISINDSSKTPTKTNVREFQPNGIGIYLGMESEEEGVESSLLPTNNDTYKSQNSRPSSPIRNLQRHHRATSELSLKAILQQITNGHSSSLRAETPGASEQESSPCRKQLENLLAVSYAAAVLGLLLCVANSASALHLTRPAFALIHHYHHNHHLRHHAEPRVPQNRQWHWLLYQTVIRALELAMGCAMANLTKQPLSRRHHRSLPPSFRHQQRNSLYM